VRAPQVLADPIQDAGDAWRGPLEVENERPLQSSFLFARPQAPDVLARGERKLGLQLDVANDLLIPRDGPRGQHVEEDFETQKLRLSYVRGLGKQAQLEVEAQLVARDGGVLDGLLASYHHLLGLAGSGLDNPLGRDAYPKGRSVFFFRDAGGNGVNQGSAFGLGDSLLTLKRQLSSGRVPLAARLLLKIPTGSGSKVLGSGGLDAGLNLDARLPISKHLAFNASVGAFAWGRSDIPDARRNGVSGTLALEYRGRHTSIIAQTTGETRAVRTGNPFADRTPVVASVGFKHDVGRNKMLWACFSENGDYHNYRAPILGNIAPDYTLSVGFEVRR